MRASFRCPCGHGETFDEPKSATVTLRRPCPVCGSTMKRVWRAFPGPAPVVERQLFPILINGPDAYISHCRFVGVPVLAQGGGSMHIHNSEFMGVPTAVEALEPTDLQVRDSRHVP